jgi:hypothetical protein
MKFHLGLILILFYLNNCQIEIDNFLTPPYQEMNFKDDDIGNIIFYFVDSVVKENFTKIYLSNSTKELILYNYNTSTNLCTFRNTMVKCIYQKEKPTMGDENNQDYKYYYSLKYITNNGTNYKGLVTVAVNSSNFIKFASIFFLIFLF